MNYRLLLILFLAGCSFPSFSQKKNGKFTIPIEKGGVEKGRIKHGQREGTWKSYNAKGDLIQEENFLNGKRNGPFVKREDSTVTTGSYLAGLKNGAFITKVNNRVVREINYKLDTLHGKYFIDSEEKDISGAYDHGAKTGLWVVDSIDYQKRRVKDSSSYMHGLREGTSVIYVNYILVTRTTWLAGKRNGPYTEYDPHTRQLLAYGSYLSNERDGTWREYENGKLRSVDDYENGIHASNSITYGSDTTIIAGFTGYYPDGAKKMVQVNDEKGKLQQRWYYNSQGNVDSIVTYYPDGQLRNGHYTAYVNDDGYTQFYLYMSYYPGGILESRGFEYRNVRNGVWLLYDSTGKLTESVHYENNVPFGWFKSYYPNGKLKLQAYCYEGITDTILVYSKTGAKLSHSDPNYSKTIDQVQAAYPEIWFRDPNKFPPENHKVGRIVLGEAVREGKWSDEPASFPGGNDSLNTFIKKTIRYPEPERRLSKEGEVQIKFLVEKDGSLSDIQILKEVEGAPGFTKETLRMVRAMPKWTPAKTNGKIVRVYYVLPVKFYLE